NPHQFASDSPEYHTAGKAVNWDRYWQVQTQLRNLTPFDFNTALSDLRIYRAQWRRILTCSLYFLEINGGQYYKIGVTQRDIQERVEDIRADLLPHLGAVQIEVLDLWPGRGNVELYFKHRYQAHNTPMGPLTEYF